MFPALQQAIIYRTNQQYTEAKQAFQTLYETHPDNALVNYHYAWLYDNLGEERNAIPYYEQSIQLGLPIDELRGALLGLGSTYRTLGMYQQSADILKKGLGQFPDANEFKIFYAMTLYNLEKPHQAISLLLKHIAQYSNDKDVTQFSRAIDLYANDLNKTWD